MELSLQSKTNSKSVYNKRKELIEKENLHIGQKINYGSFLALYKKYGEGFNEKEFARYFLDIDNMKHYCIQCGKIKETAILTREYVSYDELMHLREAIIRYYKLKPLDVIVYEDFQEMYSRFARKLSMKIFAEEILNISYHTVECWNSDPNKRAVILKERAVTQEKIEEVRNRIIEETDLHIGTLIDNNEFKKLYSQFSDGMPEREFAEKVLQMPHNSYIKLRKNTGSLASVFSNYIVNPDYIFALRERVILTEGLHIGDSLSNERFLELYEKYGGILSKEQFAEEILDIGAIGVKNMRVSGTNSLILQNIEIPDEYIDEVRKKILDENSFEQNELISYDQIKELHKKYGYVLSEKQFALLVLEATQDSYNSLICGANKRITIFKNQYTTDFEALRKRVIEENKLHYEDKFNYAKFKKFHKKYAPNVRESVFAEKVLGIPVRSYYNIKFTECDTCILRDEKLPTDEEFEELKKQIIKIKKLHTKDVMSYKTFKQLHSKYGGIIPDEMFASRILDVSKQSLRKAKAKHIESFQILLNTQMTQEEILSLRQKIILQNILYKGKLISIKDFENLYNSYHHILSPIEFADKILGINQQSLNNLKQGNSDKIKILNDIPKKDDFSQDEVNIIRGYLEDNLSDEEIATRLGVTLNFLRDKLGVYFKTGVFVEKDITYAKVYKLFVSGKTALKISNKTGVELEKVQEIIEEIKAKQKQAKLEAKQEAERIKKEQARIKREEARKAREEQSRKEREVAQKAKEEQAKKKKEEAQRAKEERARIKREEAQRAKEERARKKKEEAQRVKEEQDRKKREEAQRVKEEQDRKKREEAQRAKEEQDKKKREAAQRVKEEQTRKEKEKAKKLFESSKYVQLEKKVKSILNKFEYTPKKVAVVEEYIQCIREIYTETGSFPREKLENLAECIEFAQGGFKDIEIYARICISYRMYRSAYVFINSNMHNEGITNEERKKLGEIQKAIKYASAKLRATELIRNGNRSIESISYETGLGDIDIIRLIRQVDAEIRESKTGVNLDDEQDGK